MSTFGVIITNRSFFPDHLVLDARAKLLSALTEWGHDYVTLSSDETFMGQTMTYAEAVKCAKLFGENRAKIDGVIVCLPNFGEEAGVADALKLSGLNVPILVQACDDSLDKLQLVNRRDAFCGKLSLCNNLNQLGIKFTLTERHTCAVDSDEFHADVSRFAAVCRVVKTLRNARIGQIGSRVTPFRTVRYSEKILQRNGITVETEDFSEILADIAAIKDSARIDAKVDEIREYASVAPSVPSEKLIKIAKLCLALEDWMDARQCDASAVQCWDSVEANYGCAACLAMSMMGAKGRPSACETDVTGAVSMLALQAAAGVAPIYQDWNNNYGLEPDKCINVHCSNYPAAAFIEKPKLASLDILGTTLGEEVSFGALKGRVKAAPMTFLKVTTDDTRGIVKCYLGEGEFTDDAADTFGGVAVCHVNNLNALMRYICENGFEHHVALVQAEAADALYEALSKYMGWEVHRHS